MSVWTAACFAQQATVPSTQLAQDIAALVARQTNLIMQRDPAGLAALFTPDATYVAANGAAFTGRTRIQAYYTQLFEILNQSQALIGSVTRQNRLEQVVPWGDGAWAIGRGVNVASAVEQSVATSDHWVAIYARVGGEWKIRLLSVGEDAPRALPQPRY